MGLALRHIRACSKGRKRVLAMRPRQRDKVFLDTRQGLFLVFGIALLVSLVWILVYFAWYLPMERAVQ